MDAAPGCVGDPSNGANPQPAANTVLNTYIGATKQIEIDWPGGSAVGDMNMFLGPDPADGSASYPKPVISGATYIDWNDLAFTGSAFDLTRLQNHRVRDLDRADGRDPSAFPSNDSCVGASSVLKKFDITYIGAASNDTYVDLVVQRSGNNGDGSYYWLFTKNAAEHVTNGNCTNWVQYDVSQYDVLIVGQFSPSSGAAVKVYSARTGVANLGVRDASDPTYLVGALPLWLSATSSLAIVNTTDTAPGAWASVGIDPNAFEGCNLQPNIMAEAAIPLSAFNVSTQCGSAYFGSVITRSSGANGANQDVKDYTPSVQFNFGSLNATVTATGGCAGVVTLSAAVDMSGSAVTPTSCTWTRDGVAITLASPSANNCSGTYADSGTHTYAVSAEAGCPAPATASAQATTASALTVNLSPDSTSLTCNGITSSGDDVTYTANVSGGSGTGRTYTWTGACAGTANTSATCTIDPTDATLCYSASLGVSVDDDSDCAPVTSESETYTKVTTVTASNNPAL